MPLDADLATDEQTDTMDALASDPAAGLRLPAAPETQMKPAAAVVAPTPPPPAAPPPPPRPPPPPPPRPLPSAPPVLPPRQESRLRQAQTVPALPTQRSRWDISGLVAFGRLFRGARPAATAPTVDFDGNSAPHYLLPPRRRPLMDRASVALRPPRASTPLSQAPYRPREDADGSIESVIQMYEDFSPTSSPHSSIAGMMRNTLEIRLPGLQPDHDGVASALSQSAPHDRLQGHQARQLAALEGGGRRRFQGPHRPPSATSHREQSLTSEHGSFIGAGPRQAVPRFRGAHNTHYNPPRPSSRSNNWQGGPGPYARASYGPAIPFHRSETNLRTPAAGYPGPRPTRGFGRGQGFGRPHSPALSDRYYPRRDVEYSDRSASPSMSSMQHLARRNQSMSNVRERQWGGPLNSHPPFQQYPPYPQSMSPGSGHMHNPPRMQRARATSNLSTGSRRASQAMQPRRGNFEAAQVPHAPGPPSVSGSDYYDYTEGFESFFDRSYVCEEIQPITTPHPASQRESETTSNGNNEEEHRVTTKQDGTTVESPSPIAASQKITQRRLSDWAKNPSVENVNRQSETEFDDTESSLPIFGGPYGAGRTAVEPATHKAIITGPTRDLVMGGDRTFDLDESPSQGAPAEGSGLSIGKAISTDQNNQDDDPQSADKAAQSTYRIPSMQFSNVSLSSHHDKQDEDVVPNTSGDLAPGPAPVADEPSWTDGFLDMVQNTASVDTQGGLGRLQGHAPPGPANSIPYRQGFDTANANRQQHSAAFRREQLPGDENMPRSRGPPRRGVQQRGVARPESEINPWIVNAPRPGQQPPVGSDRSYDRFQSNIPPRTSSRRPGGLSDVDEESVGARGKRTNQQWVHGASSEEDEASVAVCDERSKQDDANATRRLRIDARMAHEAKKYEQIERDYPSPYDESKVLMDGAGDTEYFDRLAGGVRGMEVPRLEITRATGSTGRSLTQSDESLDTLRPLSKRLQLHVEGGKKPAESQFGNEGTQKRAKFAPAPSHFDGDGLSGSNLGRPPPLTRVSSRPKVSKPLPSSVQPRTLDPRAAQHLSDPPAPEQSLLGDAIVRRSGDQHIRDEVSLTLSVDSAGVEKHSSLCRTSAKPPKGPIKRRIKGWLARKGLWKSGKGKESRGPGRAQSDQGV